MGKSWSWEALGRSLRVSRAGRHGAAMSSCSHTYVHTLRFLPTHTGSHSHTRVHTLVCMLTHTGRGRHCGPGVGAAPQPRSLPSVHLGVRALVPVVGGQGPGWWCQLCPGTAPFLSHQQRLAARAPGPQPGSACAMGSQPQGQRGSSEPLGKKPSVARPPRLGVAAPQRSSLLLLYLQLGGGYLVSV